MTRLLAGFFLSYESLILHIYILYYGTVSLLYNSLAEADVTTGPSAIVNDISNPIRSSADLFFCLK